MKFEEKFPSFNEYPKEQLEEFKKNYMAEAVRKHCLDKQKVKEVIDKLKEHEYVLEARNEYLREMDEQNVSHDDFNPSDFLVGYHKARKKIKKELGLE